MRLTVLRCGLVGMIVMVLAVPVFGGDLAPAAVSPGAMERFSGVDDRCPTFSWQGAPGAEAYELLVYELPPGFDPLSTVGLDDAVEVIFARLPGGVSSWTPPSESRLARGANHAWFVRALFDADTGDATGGSDWSEGRFFRVEMAPTAAEVREALDVLAAYTEHGGGAALTSDAAPATLADREAPASTRRAEGGRSGTTKIAGIDSVDTGIAAIRGEVPNPSGETYGVVGISNSPSGAGLGAMNTGGGADLVLDGSADGRTDARLTEIGLDRSGAGNRSFDFTNSGGGALNVTVQGLVSAVSLVGDGAGLTSVDAETLDGIDGEDLVTDAELATHGDSADHDIRYFTEAELTTSGGGGAVHWDNLTQVPTGLDDGDDNTTYTASSPIAIVGTEIRFANCQLDQSRWWNGSTWACGTVNSARIENYSITTVDLDYGAVRRGTIDGSEVNFYDELAICGGSGFTLESLCWTSLCNPSPMVYYACNGSCSSSSSSHCPNTKIGYLLAPDGL